jgi:ABC-2 type transport system ATP-binding protein
LIQVDALTKFYGSRAAVDDVTFAVKEGEILGFLGPNGAGKTTTMRILAGFMPATSGKASVAGFDVFSQSLQARQCVGYLPENVPMYPEMTVRSYLDYQATLRGVPRSYRPARVKAVAERCRVDDVLNTRIGKLSKGYRQRVGLAQAIVHDPKVLILDEPTVGLDPNQISQTRALIKSLGGSHTVILSTHILPEVSMTCDRVAIINEGRLVAQDTPANLTRRLQGHDRVEVEVRGPAEDVAKALRSVPSVVGVDAQAQDGRTILHVESAAGQDVRERVASTIVQGGWGLLGLQRITLSLEDVFLRLTTTEDAAAAATGDYIVPTVSASQMARRPRKR